VPLGSGPGAGGRWDRLRCCQASSLPVGTWGSKPLHFGVFFLLELGLRKEEKNPVKAAVPFGGRRPLGAGELKVKSDPGNLHSLAAPAACVLRPSIRASPQEPGLGSGGPAFVFLGCGLVQWLCIGCSLWEMH